MPVGEHGSGITFPLRAMNHQIKSHLLAVQDKCAHAKWSRRHELTRACGRLGQAFALLVDERPEETDVRERISSSRLVHMGAWLQAAELRRRLRSTVEENANLRRRCAALEHEVPHASTSPRHEIRIAFGLHAAQHDSRTTRSCPVRVHARKLITGPHRFARGGRRQRVATAAALIRQLVTSPLSRWYGCFQRERRRSQGGWQPVDHPRLGVRGTCERSGGRA